MLIDLALNPQFTLVIASIFDYMYIWVLKKAADCLWQQVRYKQTFVWVTHTHTYMYTHIYILTVPNAQPYCSHVRRVTIA